MLTQPVARQRCASCARWTGERAAGPTPDCVVIESETATGLCTGGPWDGSERRARSACGHWTMWAQLAPPGENAPP